MKALHNLAEKPSLIETNTTKKSPLTVYETSKKLIEYIEKLKAEKPSSSFEEQEQIIQQFLQQLGCAAVEEILPIYDESSAVIRVGEQSYRRKYACPKTYESAFGPVTVTRHLYVNRKKDGDGKSICPLELRTGIVGNYWTPKAAKQSAYALSLMTPQEVEDLYIQLGMMMPSRSSLDRLPKLLNQVIEPECIEFHEQLMDEETVPEGACFISTSLDGVMVAMKPLGEKKEDTSSRTCEWHEASCGTISFYDEAGERLLTRQYGRMPESKKVTLKTLLQKNIEKILSQNKNLKLIHIADGAQDNWTFFDERMPVGFELFDYYHACEHLKEAIDIAYKNEPQKAKDYYDKHKIILRDEIDGVKKVIRALRYLRCQHKNNDIMNRTLKYFTKNQHRMQYATAKALNYPIGSGIVEAACKSLVGQRLKHSGMSWCQHGGQAILTLRSLVKSHRFDKAWEYIAKSFQQKIITYDNIIEFPQSAIVN